jgi:peptide/nickel transport system substrate-binding protein
MFKNRLVTFAVILVLAVALLPACQPQATETPAEVPTEGQAAPTQGQAAPTEVSPTEAPPTEVPPTEVAGPPVGGNFVFGVTEEPDTLDIYKSAFAVASLVTSNMGASLVAKNSEGQMVPYLAKSWEISEDGLTYTFHLRDDVKFSNGDPFTANDYVWTWDRCRAEGFVCPVSASLLQPLTSYEATDDYTFVLHLAEPNYYTLSNLGAYDYLQPLDKNVVEAEGDNYGMNVAVGVGPYMLKEWVQDEKIVLERNPNFVWGPEFFPDDNTGPYYVDTYEFRILPDLSTVLAGLEAGELGFTTVEPKDVQTVLDTENYQIEDMVPTGITYVSFNLENPTWKDYNVRKAFNLATDKQTILNVVLEGKGVVIDGPLSPAMVGYDEAAMKGTGYGFDLEAAKQLMQDAGYTYGSDGMLVTPDGQPLTIDLLGTTDETTVKIMQILVDMWGKLGAQVSIEQLEWGTMAPKVFAGDYQVCMMSVGWPDADVMYLMYHSSNIGGVNFAYLNDPQMDQYLETARTDVTPEGHQAAVDAAYKYVVDNAFMIPLVTPTTFYAVRNDFQGVEFSNFVISFANLYYTGQ